MGAATGRAPSISAVGSDTDVGLNVITKNNGKVTVNSRLVATKVAVPATSTVAGYPGSFAADANFIYVYTGDGTTHSWVRSAAATW